MQTNAKMKIDSMYPNYEVLLNNLKTPVARSAKCDIETELRMRARPKFT